MGGFIFTSAYCSGKYTQESIMESPPNSANNTRQRALPSPNATFPLPDDKEDDRGALTGASHFPDY
jgi:hypothetical protein